MSEFIEADSFRPGTKRASRVKAALTAVLLSSLPAGIARADDNLPQVINKPAAATAQAERKRTYAIGDSIIWDECSLLEGVVCDAFPGGWTSDINGTNLLAGFIQNEPIQPGDTVILSNISAWLRPDLGIDNTVVLDRLQAAYDTLVSLQAKVVVLIAPDPNFPLCTTNYDGLPKSQRDFIGSKDHWQEACETQSKIRELEVSWPVPHITIPGPYNPDDGVHPTAGPGGGEENLSRMLIYGIANGWD